jgi:hypothetical protein
LNAAEEAAPAWNALHGAIWKRGGSRARKFACVKFDHTPFGGPARTGAKTNNAKRNDERLIHHP